MMSRLLHQGMPDIKTSIPGPKSKDILPKHMKVWEPSPFPFVIDKAEGAIICDVDGNKFLDMAYASEAVTGFNNEDIKKAVIREAKQLIRYPRDSWMNMAKRQCLSGILKYAPDCYAMNGIVLSSRSRALKRAIDISREVTEREVVLAIEGNKKQYEGLGEVSLTPMDEFISAANGKTPTGLVAGNTDFSEVFKKVAAIIYEPIILEAGCMAPPRKFYDRLKFIAEEFGVLLICNETRTAFGRTGTFFASRRWIVKPDVIVVAEGGSAGMTMALLILGKSVDTSRIQDDPNMSLACVSARETLRMLEEDLLIKFTTKEELMHSSVYHLAESYECIEGVQGKGLIWGISFYDNEYGDESLAKLVLLACVEKGLLVDITSNKKAVILMPPLTINEKQINRAFQILNNVILKIKNKSNRKRRTR